MSEIILLFTTMDSLFLLCANYKKLLKVEAITGRLCV